MLVSESWIREWVSPPIDTNALGEKLTLAGLEVDTIASAGPALDNKRIVVGRICSVAAHPDAKKLQVCDVDVGKKHRLSIICGAPNARKGLVTAVATNNSIGSIIQTKFHAGTQHSKRLNTANYSIANGHAR